MTKFCCTCDAYVCSYIVKCACFIQIYPLIPHHLRMGRDHIKLHTLLNCYRNSYCELHKKLTSPPEIFYCTGVTCTCRVSGTHTLILNMVLECWYKYVITLGHSTLYLYVFILKLRNIF